MRVVKHRSVAYEIKHYEGSLDFPCNFCNGNSYDNYHIEVAGNLVMVVCKDCLKKVLCDKNDDR